MTRLILFGAAGRMGKEVEAAAEKAGDIEIVARVDVSGADGCFPSLDQVRETADVIVDFSHHAATRVLTDYAVQKKIPLLIATTGQTDEELGMIRAASDAIPVFFAANYSLGIAALIRCAKWKSTITANSTPRAAPPSRSPAPSLRCAREKRRSPSAAADR